MKPQLTWEKQRKLKKTIKTPSSFGEKKHDTPNKSLFVISANQKGLIYRGARGVVGEGTCWSRGDRKPLGFGLANMVVLAMMAMGFS